MSDVRIKVTNAAHFDQRSGQEATQTDVHDQAALDDLNDGAFNDTIFFLDLLDVAPSAFVLCTLLGEDETAFFVFLLEDESLNNVANRNNFVGVDVVLDGEFTRRDNRCPRGLRRDLL